MRCNVSQIYYFCKTLTRFRRFFHPSSGAQNRKYSVRHLSDRYCYLLPAVTVWQMPDAVFAVLCSWWWMEKPSETGKRLTEINKFEKRCISLVVLWEYYSFSFTVLWPIMWDFNLLNWCQWKIQLQFRNWHLNRTLPKQSKSSSTTTQTLCYSENMTNVKSTPFTKTMNYLTFF